MGASQSNNCFVTNNFKTFVPLTNVYPEKKYNWLTTELISWRTLDGSWSRGVLYKPENFDSTKKYPIIFFYYTDLSDQLNVYINPDAPAGPINISYFVSNGYLVFAPDIRYKMNRTIGESAINSIVSAAKYFAAKSWVDAKKMGLNGHSFGGYETNYLITHTKIFAAACSGAGVSDFISRHLSLRPEEGYQNEPGYYSLKGNPWSNRDAFIKNSPIFFVDKVTSPILIFHDKNDMAVPFAQGLEFFLALKEAKKKVWMLQYDEGDHIISGRSAQDYSIRLSQFFDHYLKGKPAPVWMTRGVRAKLKGKETGLALDSPDKEP